MRETGSQEHLGNLSEVGRSSVTVDELQRPMRILLGEDNPADVRLVREALKGRAIQFSIVPNGEEALAFLRHEGPYAAAARPDMILQTGRTGAFLRCHAGN